MRFDDDIDDDILKAFTFFGSVKHDPPPPPQNVFCLSWLTKAVKLTTENVPCKESSLLAWLAMCTLKTKRYLWLRKPMIWFQPCNLGKALNPPEPRHLTRTMETSASSAYFPPVIVGGKKQWQQSSRPMYHLLNKHLLGSCSMAGMAGTMLGIAKPSLWRKKILNWSSLWLVMWTRAWTLLDFFLGLSMCKQNWMLLEVLILHRVEQK